MERPQESVRVDQVVSSKEIKLVFTHRPHRADYTKCTHVTDT